MKKSFTIIYEKNNQAMFTEISKHKSIAYEYYITKVNEEQYLVKKYKFHQFQTLITKISSLKVDFSLISKVENHIDYKHLSKKLKVRKIIYNSLNGVSYPYGGKRIYKIKTVAPYDHYEEKLLLLNKLWKNDLKNLLYQSYSERGVSSELMADYIYKRLRFEENITPQIIDSIVNDFKDSLKQKYKFQKAKRKSLSQMKKGELINEYLNTYLSQDTDVSLWSRQLDDCVSGFRKIKKGHKNNYEKQIKNLEVSILDKNDDIFRSLRFADSTRNCIRSDRKPEKLKNYLYGVRKIDIPAKVMQYMIKVLYFDPVMAVACIYKDPFTFIIDIKDSANGSIIGFVYARLAINPVNGNFIIMINNVYLREANSDIVTKIVTIIEKNIGKALKAEGIIYTDNWEKNLNINQYTKQTIKVIPLVGINNYKWWLPQKLIYDDFSFRGNVQSDLYGYYKAIDSKSVASEVVIRPAISDYLLRPIYFVLKKMDIIAFLLLFFLAVFNLLLLFKFNRNQSELYTNEILVFILFIKFSFSKYKTYSQFKYLFIDYFSKLMILLLFFLFIANTFIHFS